MEEPDAPQAPDRGRARDQRTGRDAAANRIAHQTHWVEQQIRASMERGEFDDLPGLGEPIQGLGKEEHDPDWWVKKLVEREQISVLPPALAIRREDAVLEQVLDRLAVESEVRREVEDFNTRVRAARIQPLGGPPMITRERDVGHEVASWQERRRVRRAAAANARASAPDHRGDRSRGVARLLRGRARPAWRRRRHDDTP